MAPIQPVVGLWRLILKENCYMDLEIVITFLFLAWGFIFGPELSFYSSSNNNNNNKGMSTSTVRGGLPPGLKYSYVIVVGYLIFVFH